MGEIECLASGLLVLSDGGLAVAGSSVDGYGHEQAGNLTILDSIDLKAGSYKSTSRKLNPGAHLLLGLPGKRVAVSFIDVACGQGHIEVYEEEALRTGGDPLAILRTSGAVRSMVLFGDGRIAASSITGGFRGGW